MFLVTSGKLSYSAAFLCMVKIFCAYHIIISTVYIQIVTQPSTVTVMVNSRFILVPMVNQNLKEIFTDYLSGISVGKMPFLANINQDTSQCLQFTSL